MFDHILFSQLIKSTFQERFLSLKMQHKQKQHLFRSGDYVRFHTQYGHATGIIDGKPPAPHCPRAIITVRNGTFKPKKYIRPVYKLKLMEK